MEHNLSTKTFLEGAAGTGKTTIGTERLAYLLQQGIPANKITVMVPQRTLALPYYDLLAMPEIGAGGQVNIATLGGIARRMVDLFWPLVAAEHGFAHPNQRPQYLTLETTQYFMARVVGPVIDTEGYFDNVTIDRNRLYSQIIDNLNKAAVVHDFSYTEVGERLKSAWTGDPVQLRMYDDVQECMQLFRQFCLEHNLLDFSLQVELFIKRLWKLPQCRDYLTKDIEHIIAENVEEDTPAAHNVLRVLVENAESALLIYDTQAGYRRFLGADTESGYSLRDVCDEQIVLTESFVTPPALQAFSHQIMRSLGLNAPETDTDPRVALAYDDYRYHPQMLDGVAERIISLVNDEGVDPAQIVVIAPYLSDALRFSLMNRLEVASVPVRSHRPSRALREQPASRCLLTLAQVAHPEWNLSPTVFDTVYAVMQAIDGVDLGRAQLLVGQVYSPPELLSFDAVNPGMQERITFVLGERYDQLRDWLMGYASGEERLDLDHFFNRLFGEVLSQEGFGFHTDFDAAETAANLIDSAQKFRWMMQESGIDDDQKPVGQEYVEMVGQGVIADLYLRGWERDETSAVLLAPAYTFLLSNEPVDYQIWLNVGEHGWAERLYQPLTNPYVLTRQWEVGRKWTDTDEVIVTQDALYRLVLGLVRRCRRGIYLGFSELGEQGYEQRGLLLNAVQGMLRRLAS
jgi:hypothetical protein